MKVADFGLAKDEDANRWAISEPGVIMGTAVLHVPRAGARGEGRDHRSDIYSLGATLYHMLSGKRLFDGGSPVSIVMKQANDRPRPPSARAPGIPADLDRIVVHTLAEEPGRPLSDGGGDGLRPGADRGRAPDHPRDGGRRNGRAGRHGRRHGCDAGPSARPVPPGGGRPPPYDPYSDRNNGDASFLPWLVDVGLLLAAFAAAGCYVYRQIDERLQESAPVAVPDVEGVVLSRAVERLEAEGFEVNVERQPGGDLQEGDVVIDQDPEPGARVEKGSPVVITVSSGLPQVEVPRVIGLQLAGGDREAE